MVEKAFQYVKPLNGMHISKVTFENIPVNDTSLKTRFFGLHFCPRQYWSIFSQTITLT